MARCYQVVRRLAPRRVGLETSRGDARPPLLISAPPPSPPYYVASSLPRETSSGQGRVRHHRGSSGRPRRRLPAERLVVVGEGAGVLGGREGLARGENAAKNCEGNLRGERRRGEGGGGVQGTEGHEAMSAMMFLARQ